MIVIYTLFNTYGYLYIPLSLVNLFIVFRNIYSGYIFISGTLFPHRLIPLKSEIRRDFVDQVGSI